MKPLIRGGYLAEVDVQLTSPVYRDEKRCEQGFRRDLKFPKVQFEIHESEEYPSRFEDDLVPHQCFLS